MSDWTEVKFTKKNNGNRYTKINQNDDKTNDNSSDNPWDQVTVLRKNTRPNPNDPKNTVVQMSRNTSSNTQSQKNVNAHMLDAETSTQPIQKVSLSLGQTIAKERIARKMTQKDLALKTNGKLTFADVQSIESGKMILTNNDKIVHIERALNVHLRGKHIGEPLFTSQKQVVK